MFLHSSIRLTQNTVPRRRENCRWAHRSLSLCTMWLEDRVLLSTGPANPSAAAPLLLSAAVMNSAVPIAIDSAASGNVTSGGANVYEIEPDSDGRLLVQVQSDAGSLQLRLSLYDGQGNLLVQSDGQSSGRPDPLIDQHVAAGADFVEVQGLSGSGGYSLSASLTASSGPSQTLALPLSYQGNSYAPIAVGDFTDNGILDIVAPDGVHLGTRDGTFEAPSATGALVDPSTMPTAIAVGNFNGDRDGNQSDRDRRHRVKRAVAVAHQYDDVIRGAPRVGDGNREVGDPIAGEVARHNRIGDTSDRQADRRRLVKRAVAIAQRDRDRLGAEESDGHVQVLIAVEVPNSDRSRHCTGINECAGRGRGLKRPIAGAQVDAVWGHDVQDTVVREVADGDRRVTAPLVVGRERKGLRRAGRRRQ